MSVPTVPWYRLRSGLEGVGGVVSSVGAYQNWPMHAPLDFWFRK